MRSPFLQPEHQSPLEKYISTHILVPTDNNSSSKITISLTAILGILNTVNAVNAISLAGATNNPTVIFPDNGLRDFAKILLPIAAVITIASNGLWVILEVGKQIKLEYTLSQSTFQQKKYRIVKWIASVLLSILACIPSAYAISNKHSRGKNFLAVLASIFQLNYALYGYSTLIDEIIHKTKSCISRVCKPNFRELLSIKETILTGIEEVLSNGKTFGMATCDIKLSDTPKNLFNDLIRFVESDIHPKKTLIKKAIQLFSGATVSLGAGLVDLFLTKKLISSSLSSSEVFIYGLAILVATPNAAIHFMATKELSGKVFDRFLRCKKFDPLLGAIYPKLSWFIPFATLLTGLTASFAGAYEAYHTFSTKYSTPYFLTWLAISSIISARFFFSIVTLNHLINEFALYIAKKSNPQCKKVIEDIDRLKNLLLALPNFDPAFFSEVVPLSTPNSTGSSNQRDFPSLGESLQNSSPNSVNSSNRSKTASKRSKGSNQSDTNRRRSCGIS